MPTLTYDNIASVTLSGSTSTHTFSSIPQGYKDLRIIISGNWGGNVLLRMNGFTDARYYWVETAFSNSIGVNEQDVAATSMQVARGSSSSFSGPMAILDFFDYTNAPASPPRRRNIMGRSGNRMPASTGYVGTFMTGTCNTDQAINSITLFTSASYFDDGTTITLYGIG